MKNRVAVLIVCVALTGGCYLPPPGSANSRGTLEMRLVDYGGTGIDREHIRLYVDGAFIGYYSDDHRVLQLRPGRRKVRIETYLKDKVDKTGYPLIAEVYEEHVLILGGTNHQTMIVPVKTSLAP